MRDATFAARTLEAHAASPGPAPVVLIAGSGHARKDRGVPLYLSRVQPDARVRVVGFIEAGTAKDPGLYDVIRVTDAAQRDDPCDGFVRQSGA
ncbi:ChaN family lipoprotein [uncultured Algimonas sp.]|uniref:ChaN family lipoprotein n=1 Tax=uncultured Algimonas sp. TaxID=1547920 RepID=UPI002622CBDA|nr:ChaN family lipoprotein [uncultured Algimonas sp.]